MNERSVAVGEPAPDFTLASTTGEDETLSTYRGKANVLLAFFPLAFTGTCTTELCDFSEELSQFDDTSTKIFGISVDSIPALREFRKQRNIKVDLLSDFRRQVSRAYGTLIEDLFFSERAYFILDKQGIVRWRHVEADLGEKRKNAELLEELRTL